MVASCCEHPWVRSGLLPHGKGPTQHSNALLLEIQLFFSVQITCAVINHLEQLYQLFCQLLQGIKGLNIVD